VTPAIGFRGALYSRIGGMFLAFREMSRAKGRFALLSAAIILLVFLIIFLQTIAAGLVGAFTGALAHQSGPVVVYGADARKNLSGSVVTPDQLAATRAVPGVAQADPLYEGAFTMRAAGTDVDGFLFGYRLGGLGAPTRLVRGRLPRTDGEAVASSADASRGFGLGRTVELVPPTPGTPPRSIRIVGLADESQFSTQPTLFVSTGTYTDARKFVNPDARVVYPSAILAEPERGLSPSALAGRINRAVAGVEALDRDTAVASLPGVKPVENSFQVLVSLTAFVVIAVVGLFFAILRVQKTPAITLLRATGASNAYIRRNFVAQVAVVLLTAFVVAFTLLVLVVTTADFSIPISIGTGAFAWGAGTIAFAFVAALLAFRRVFKVDPLDATRTAGLSS